MTYNKQNPLRVVTLCSGYDSQCLALNRLKEAYPEFDYTLIAWSEFDPESNTPLDKQPAVVAHKALFPQWADGNLGDMTKIDWEKVPDFDLLFYSTPCQSISQAGLQHGFPSLTITPGTGYDGKGYGLRLKDGSVLPVPESLFMKYDAALRQR